MAIKFRAQFSNAGCNAAFSNISTLSIVPTPTVTLDPLANQTVCNGANTAQENFTGSNATAYNWTNDNPSIGLAASGSSPIASPFIAPFVAVNTGFSTCNSNHYCNTGKYKRSYSLSGHIKNIYNYCKS
jgi:hypothetical protein